MKVSKSKLANKASQKSSKTKKLKNRKRVKYSKKDGEEEVLNRKAVTYFDLKKQRDSKKNDAKVKKEENKAQGKKRKHFDDDAEGFKIPMRSDLLAEVDDTLDPEMLEALIRQEDERYVQLLDEQDEDKKKDKSEGEDDDHNMGMEVDDLEDDQITAEGETEQETLHLALKAKEQEAKQAAADKEEIRGKSLLPIKILDQVIPQTKQLQHSEDPATTEPVTEKSKDHTSAPDTGNQGPVSLPIVSVIDIMAQRKSKLYEKQLFIGNAAPAVMAKPEERMGQLMELVSLLYEVDADICLTVRKMAALSLLRVFTAILPSYRLGTLDKPGQKLKRETRDCAVQENKLLSRYKYYLKGLEAVLERARFKKYEELDLRLAKVALHCFCELLRQKPVFNYADKIIELLVPYLSSKQVCLRDTVCDAFTAMFCADETGQFSLRLVKKLNTFVRSQEFQVHTAVFKCLLSLRITRTKPLDETLDKKLTSARERKETEIKLKKMRSFTLVKMPTIKEKKRKRKIAILEHKLKNKREEEHKNSVDTLHTELLEILFGLYVHVIKNDINRQILGAVLQGLASFGHLVNVEYFSALLHNLERVLHTQKLSPIECVHCVQTVFRLLSGLGAALPNDPSNFSDKLFAVLCKVKPTDSSIEALVSGLRTVISIFIGNRGRVSSMQTIGYVKRIATLALTVTHKHTLPALLTARSLMLTHRVTECLLDTSSEGGSGVYQSRLHHPVHCNAGVTTLWESTLLARSYHPLVRQVGVHLCKGAPLLGDGCLPASFTKLNVEEVYKQYNDIRAPLPPLANCGAMHWTGKDKKRIYEAPFNNVSLQCLMEREEEGLATLMKKPEETQQSMEDDDSDDEEDSEESYSDGDEEERSGGDDQDDFQ